MKRYITRQSTAPPATAAAMMYLVLLSPFAAACAADTGVVDGSAETVGPLLSIPRSIDVADETLDVAVSTDSDALAEFETRNDDDDDDGRVVELEEGGSGVGTGDALAKRKEVGVLVTSAELLAGVSSGDGEGVLIAAGPGGPGAPGSPGI